MEVDHEGDCRIFFKLAPIKQTFDSVNRDIGILADINRVMSRCACKIKRLQYLYYRVKVLWFALEDHLTIQPSQVALKEVRMQESPLVVS